MEEYSSTPLFTVGQEIGNFLLSCGILSKAWEESDLARNSESFSLTEHEGVAYVAFPSFNKIESFIVKLSEYGEGNIQSNNKVFSDCLRGNDDKPALVHQGALKLFLHIMEKTDFQAKLQIYTDSKQRKLKPIIFVGHSLGGAVATLATLWVLEKRLRQSSPFCITFGCPLVGDANLVEAVGRENWAGNFLHVVSKHDIVPRMLLAPLKSIDQPLTAIFPYWHGKPADSFIQDACKTLLENVRQCTCTLVNYEVDSFGGSDGVIERSPYKPFGTYMFCSSHGAACIDNSETILMMLHLTMQSQELLSDNIVMDWFSEHIGYGSVLKPVIENSISGKRFAIPDSESSYEMGISLQLEAIGVGAQDDQTRIFFLPIAGDIENHLNKNVTKLTLELSFKKGTMAELELYKDSCEKEYGITYYDSFKSQDMKDIVAGDRRVKLGDFWDEIIEMWENHELPSDFESQNKWINAGNTYRRLVEPLDIAHYYLTNGNGNYLSDGRPNRHKVIQKWMEAKEKTRSSRGQRPRTKRASLTQDSCFWACVEEAWKDLENLKQGQHESLQNLEKFEEYVTTMEKALSISSDVFLEGSSFMRWWEEWKEFKKNQSPGWSSPLYNVMESESRFRIISDGGGIISEDSVEILLNSRVSVGGRISEVSVWGTSMWFWEIIFGFFKWLSNWTLSMIYTVVGVENTNIPSTGVVNENIFSTQEIDCAQLRKRETELIRVQGGMFELERYKMICDEKDDGYYDTFKNRNDESDISSSNAILRRAELNQFWDEIIGMCESRELPRDFQSRNKWINAGTVYRKLVEPLDIAHYYRTCRGSGNYISDGRQKRHEVLEKWLVWLEGRKTNRSSRDQKARTELPFLTRDSCFWAHVEEALKDLKKGARDQKKESLENFEGYVTQMINDNKISLDVFMERSSFMKWWQAYKQIQSSEWKLNSPLYKLMESEFWKRSKPFLLLSGRRTSFKDTRFEGRKVHPPKPKERPYPKNAVGIEKPLKKVMELLEWESKESAVAVILHGVGGMGKTTLAEAVFAQDYIEGCRFSKVILDNATSTRDIVKLQKVIIEDLKIGEEIPNISTSEGIKGEEMLASDTIEDGQQQIIKLLETQVAFIYIDNVSKGPLLEQLLPSSRNLEKAKKLRVLITTRYENVKNGCPRGMKREVHKMIGLEREEGSRLFYDNIYNVTDNCDGIKGQLDKIIDSCCGIPILLKTIARSISSENDIDRVMEDIKGWKGVTFEEIDECLLSYIPNEFKEEFLDICCYFKGWEWETVANIVGIFALEMLANRAVISKDKNMTLSVHDVILDMGKKEAMNTRFELTSATPIEIKQFLAKETKDIQVIKGLMLGHQLLPAEKLNLMHKSLRIFAHKGGVDGHSEKLFEKLLFYKGEAPHFPFAWWQLTALRFLNCQPQNLNLLKEIPPTLTHIELDGSLCSDVSEISFSDIQRLKHLRVLRLINFKNWKNLAGEWGADVIESLKELTLSNCTSIEQLTGSISMLKNLKILNLEHCWNLKQLPDDFGSLSSLEILKFSHCYVLEELPKSISELQKLKIMTMNFCNIRRLPKECESLSSSLKELNLRNCTSLKALPTSLGNALDLETRLLFEHKGVLTDSPSDYESDTD